MSDLTEQFAAALLDVGGQTVLCGSTGEARAVLHRLVAGRSVTADDDPVLTPLLGGFDVVTDPWAAAVGVTTAFAAVADTGTLALPFDATHRRSTSLVPPMHIAVVPADRLVPSYAEAVTRVSTLAPMPSAVRMVTGPSSSADIEMTLVRGMHGPVELHVLLMTAS